MTETVKLYRDKSGTLWKGPLYCGNKVMFCTLDLIQERSVLDLSWVTVDWRVGMSLKALNKWLTKTQLDINASMMERAYQVAVQAHAGQTRWNGDDYVTHPIRVAEALRARLLSTGRVADDEQIVAYLHDVIEDTDVSRSDLESFGFTESQLESLDSVTKRSGENYRDFVLRARENLIGRVVKMADIKDNLRDLDGKKNKTKRDKYELALWILEH